MILLTFTIPLSITITTLVIAIVIPDSNARKNADGSLTDLPLQLQRTFTLDRDFAPLPKPGDSDWLSSHNEQGQTYRQFLNSRPNMPGIGERNIISLQSLGKFPKSAPKIDPLHNYLEAFLSSHES